MCSHSSQQISRSSYRLDNRTWTVWTSHSGLQASTCCMNHRFYTRTISCEICCQTWLESFTSILRMIDIAFVNEICFWRMGTLTMKSESVADNGFSISPACSSWRSSHSTLSASRQPQIVSPYKRLSFCWDKIPILSSFHHIRPACTSPTSWTLSCCSCSADPPRGLP